MDITTTGKEEFIKRVDSIIREMKEEERLSSSCEHTVICKNVERDVKLEFWDITFHNFKGSEFKANINLWVRLKDGTEQSKSISRACETWDTKKEFLQFLDCECDK